MNTLNPKSRNRNLTEIVLAATDIKDCPTIHVTDIQAVADLIIDLAVIIEGQTKPECAYLLDRWVNMYPSGFSNIAYETEEEAKRVAAKNLVRTVHMREVKS